MTKEFRKFFTIFLLLLQIFGMAPFIYPNKNTMLEVFTKFYHFIIFIILLVNIWLKLTVNLNQVDSINEMVDTFLLYMLFIAHLGTVLEGCITYRKHINFISRMYEIIWIFEYRLKFKINYVQLKKNVLWKLYGSFVVMIIFYSIGVFVLENTLNFWGFTIISWILIRLRFLQLSATIDLLTAMLRNLVIILKDMPNGTGRNLLIQKIVLVKNVYAKIYENVLLVNTVFGWSMCLIFIQIIFDLLSTLYWALVNYFYIGSTKLAICINVFNRNKNYNFIN